jgi:hypothetical protein
LFEQRPVDPDGRLGETESAAIDRMMGIVQNIVGAERPVTKQEAPSGAEGNTATRGPSTAHSAVIAPPHDIGLQENYRQGFMAATVYHLCPVSSFCTYVSEVYTNVSKTRK